jgi:hypothetical protein
MLQLFFSKLKILLKNPMVIFIYGIMAKWYIMIMVAAVVVTFWVFSGLKESGFLQEAEKVVFKALQDTKSVARYCVPKITSLSNFWDCLESPPRYEATEQEKAFEEGLTDLLDVISYDQKKDPYSEENINLQYKEKEDPNIIVQYKEKEDPNVTVKYIEKEDPNITVQYKEKANN